MKTVVSSFLDKARGPRKLCSALGTKTKSLGTFMRSLGALKAVRAELPRDVMGGDLFELLSNRMRALLQNDEQRSDGMDEARPRTPKFTDHPAFTGPLTQAFPSNNDSASVNPKGFATAETRSSSREEFLAKPDLRDARSLSNLFSPHPSRPSSRQEWMTMHSTVDDEQNLPARDEKMTLARRRESEMPRSLLSEKLREYWELSQSQQVEEKTSTGTAAAATKGILPQFPAPSRLSAERTQSSWPEITAQQLARKIRSSVDDRPSTHMTQTISSGAPGSKEKVEIQNVFNIEMNPGSGRSVDFTDDLSERLSDILLEQALQHGIDVT
jgi:hypothetical protein